MNGDSHCLIADLALVYLNQKERYILFPRWGGIEAGATLSDHFRIMWEPTSLDNKEKQLVHRCFVDSEDPKNHGCITRAMDHAEGSICFIKDFMDGRLDDAYSEDGFLENLGMFSGVVSHHVADLCTPVRVGSQIDFQSLGFKSLSRFHKRVEQDTQRFERRIKLQVINPKKVEISNKYFWNIAKETYEEVFFDPA